MCDVGGNTIGEKEERGKGKERDEVKGERLKRGNHRLRKEREG